MNNDILDSLQPIVDRAAKLLGFDTEAHPGTALPSARELTVAARFDLDAFELHLLQGLLAVECTPIVRLLVRSVQGNGQTWLELGTLVELLGLPAHEMGAVIARLSSDGKLVRRGLVETVDKDTAPACLSTLQARRRGAALHPWSAWRRRGAVTLRRSTT